MYSKRLANVVLFEKFNSKSFMSVDLTDLDKACRTIFHCQGLTNWWTCTCPMDFAGNFVTNICEWVTLNRHH